MHMMWDYDPLQFAETDDDDDKSSGNDSTRIGVHIPWCTRCLAEELLALRHVSLQVGELLLDLLGRQDAPQTAALAVPPLRVLACRCGVRMATLVVMMVGPLATIAALRQFPLGAWRIAPPGWRL